VIATSVRDRAVVEAMRAMRGCRAANDTINILAVAVADAFAAAGLLARSEDSGGDRIGTVTPNISGGYARCAVCEWSITESDVEEAAQMLKGHASIIHPAPVEVYR